MPTVQVVDDVVPRPEAARAHALSLVWRPWRDGDPHWLAGPLATSSCAVDVYRRLRELMPSLPADGPLPRAYFGVPSALPVDADPAHLLPHAWAAVLWLHPPEEVRGGVGFYRRCRDILQDAGGAVPHARWEETMFVPARPNRMVLFHTVPFRLTAPSGQVGHSAVQVVLSGATPL